MPASDPTDRFVPADLAEIMSCLVPCHKKHAGMTIAAASLSDIGRSGANVTGSSS